MPDKRCYLSVQEAAALVGKSPKTVRRWTKRADVQSEYRRVRSGAGTVVHALYVDVTTLPCELPENHIELTETAEGPDQPQIGMATAGTIEAALELIAREPQGTRRQLVEIAAARFGLSERTVYRRLAQVEKGQRDLTRADAGRPRIPQVARELIVRALVTNEPTTSARLIHRTILRAAPDALRYERGGEQQVVSERTVQRIRGELLANPSTALLLSDTDQRAEYLRVYSGAVLAEHANQLWQMDMTRCDVLVVDPSSGRIYRPRVHAIIDVFSGVIPGIAFSEEEGQAQTDLTLLRALLPKQGPYAESYPYWGVPKRMYWDNGSTYKSRQARRVLAGLGIEDVHSRPYVSHTRGSIERFFGTLHNLERSLPGYVGENANNRATKAIKRVERNTRNWLKHGRDPGDGNRLLTITEYQNIVLSWLITEYHPWLVNGVSRHDLFVTTAPASSLVEIDRTELLLLLAHRTERTVDAAGRIRLDNRYWTVPDGSLAIHQGRRVLVLTDQFAQAPEKRLVAWVDRRGGLEVIGEAVPAAEAAASIEAQDQRRAARQAVVEEARRQRAMKRELTDPNVRVSTVLLKEFRAAGGEVLPPTAKARLEAINPKEEVIEFAPDDVLGQYLLEQSRQPLTRSTDPIEAARTIADRHERRGSK